MTYFWNSKTRVTFWFFISCFFSVVHNKCPDLRQNRPEVKLQKLSAFSYEGIPKIGQILKCFNTSFCLESEMDKICTTFYILSSPLCEDSDVHCHFANIPWINFMKANTF